MGPAAAACVRKQEVYYCVLCWNRKTRNRKTPLLGNIEVVAVLQKRVIVGLLLLSGRRKLTRWFIKVNYATLLIDTTDNTSRAIVGYSGDSGRRTCYGGKR